MICKYVDRKGSAAMPATKRSAGFAPEVNVRDKAHTLDLKPIASVVLSNCPDDYSSSKQRKYLMTKNNKINIFVTKICTLILQCPSMIK